MISIILQAGGKSTRMGRDKAALPFLGIPLVNRLLDRFQGVGAEILLITNEPGGYEDLGIPLFKDLIPDRGALGGLYTALAVASQPLVALIAADMPFAQPKLLNYEIEVLRESGSDAVIPKTENGLEPFHALYRSSTCLPLVKRAIDSGLWKMTSWHDQAVISILNPEITRKVTGSDLTFMNLNTPEEFQEAERLALVMKDF
jgi:molybdopterin-guanine dinucleotide biosynthesis protein A